MLGHTSSIPQACSPHHSTEVRNNQFPSGGVDYVNYNANTVIFKIIGFPNILKSHITIPVIHHFLWLKGSLPESTINEDKIFTFQSTYLVYVLKFQTLQPKIAKTHRNP